MTLAELDSARLSELAHYSGDPWKPDNPYFKNAEATSSGHFEFWQQKLWPLIAGSDFTQVVDLAAGHGRHSELLFPHATHLTIIDMQEGNVEQCRKRLGTPDRITYVVNNGFDIQEVQDDLATLIFCFESMVHFDSDVVRSYMRDFKRALRRGGECLLHHSNYSGGFDWKTNPASRSFMTKELFAHYALKEGMAVVSQRVIDWGPHKALDCLTVLRRP